MIGMPMRRQDPGHRSALSLKDRADLFADARRRIHDERTIRILRNDHDAVRREESRGNDVEMDDWMEELI